MDRRSPSYDDVALQFDHCMRLFLPSADADRAAPTATVPGTPVSPSTTDTSEGWSSRVQALRLSAMRLAHARAAALARTRMAEALVLYRDPAYGDRSHRHTAAVLQTCAGDQRWQQLHEYLDLLHVDGAPRCDDQRVFHAAFADACLELIYGPRDWASHASRVMHARGIRRLQRFVMVTTPRQWGKTTSVAMFVAALMVAVPGITIAVYSIGQRQSTWMSEKTLQFVQQLPGGTESIVARNAEWLKVQTRGSHQLSTLMTLPGASHGTSLSPSPYTHTHTHISYALPLHQRRRRWWWWPCRTTPLLPTPDLRVPDPRHRTAPVTGTRCCSAPPQGAPPPLDAPPCDGRRRRRCCCVRCGGTRPAPPERARSHRRRRTVESPTTWVARRTSAVRSVRRPRHNRRLGSTWPVTRDTHRPVAACSTCRRSTTARSVAGRTARG